MKDFNAKVGRYRCVALAGRSVAASETEVSLQDYSDLTCAMSIQVQNDQGFLSIGRRLLPVLPISLSAKNSKIDKQDVEK